MEKDKILERLSAIETNVLWIKDKLDNTHCEKHEAQIKSLNRSRALVLKSLFTFLGLVSAGGIAFLFFK